MTDAWRDRLRARMTERGMTDADVTRATRLNPSFMTKLWQGVTPSVTNLAKIAHSVGLTLGELYEGDVQSKLIIDLIGFCGAHDMWAETPAGARKVPLDILSQDLVALEVTTSDWAPRYQIGDLVCGTRMVGDNLHNLLGRDCIIMTNEGTRLIKYLTRGTRKNRYHLKSMHPGVDDLLDVQVKWAAPIDFIVRGRR